MNLAEELEEFREMAPGIAGGLVGLVADNPCQFAAVVSGSYVITRGLGRLVRPSTLGGALMTATAAYGLCWWTLTEARRRGVLVFKVRDPLTGELITPEELEEREERNAAVIAALNADRGAGPALIDEQAFEREIRRRAADPG